MKILSKIKGMLIGTMALGLIFNIGTKNIYATENEITSGIYQVENDVYHESEIGMSMSRTYLLPTMNVEVTREHIIYTVGFAGSEFMENYRMKVNGQEAPVEMVEENSEDRTVKLKVAVDKVDADMDAMIYVGPMERDVEFKVIPKMETLTLLEAIEEKEDLKEEANFEIEEETLKEENLIVKQEKKDNKGIYAIAGVSAIVVIGGVIAVVKSKKK
mgnify:FL=1